MELGAQFFTIREFCKTTDDFAESLKRVADIGYKTVQISGTCEYEPQWLKEQLDLNGLRCVLTHTPGPKLLENAEEIAKRHDVFNCDHVGLGSYGFNEENCACNLQTFIEKYKPVTKTLKDNGKLFMYHNHDHEFIKHDGKLVIEHIEDNFSPDELGFTLDVFWVQAGGGDPAAWLEKLSGRVPCIHLKDYSYGKKMAVVGEGNINFDRIFEKAESAGTKYMLVEQDDCYGENPFDCLARSYKYLHSLGFK